MLVYKEVTNMTHIIDYQATQPISKTGETTF
ncbi:exosporium protein C, partial [Bacillus sp. D-CC]